MNYTNLTICECCGELKPNHLVWLGVCVYCDDAAAEDVADSFFEHSEKPYWDDWEIRDEN